MQKGTELTISPTSNGTLVTGVVETGMMNRPKDMKVFNDPASLGKFVTEHFTPADDNPDTGG